jgi:hypothetical protein
MRKFAHKGVTGFLALWLSGIVFLLCCGTLNARAEADHCPLSRMQGHCDKGASKASRFFSRVPGTREIDCCGFLPAVFDKARKIQNIEPIAHVETVARLDPPAAGFAAVRSTASVVYGSRIFVRNKIFIGNCVFRI